MEKDTIRYNEVLYHMYLLGKLTFGLLLHR